MDQSRCLNCGQEVSTHRFNLHHVFAHDVSHGLTHMDKGILFTAKELFVRPGNSIRELSKGKGPAILIM